MSILSNVVAPSVSETVFKLFIDNSFKGYVNKEGCCKVFIDGNRRWKVYTSIEDAYELEGRKEYVESGEENWILIKI